MEKVRIGIVGMGNMGCGHARNLINGKVKGAVLAAVCDNDKDNLSKFALECPDIPAYSDYKDLIASGKVDAVIVATYHYSHPEIAIAAFSHGLHVLIEKPAGVYTKQVEEMNKVAAESGKVFCIMYCQRTHPYYQKIRDLYRSGELGELKRASWIITTWYRPQAYHDSSSWRSTWKYEGGGALINQCPHQLDLWQWILGMPKTVFAKMSFGKYYDIEVEDDVTAFMEYDNGATGVFITSTGETPGINRFEIAGTRGNLVCENGKIKFYRNRIDEREHNRINTKGFAKPEFWECDIPCGGEGSMHVGIMEDFVSAITKGTPLLAPGEEGIYGLTLSNAMHLSAWTGETVTLPVDEDRFYNLLQEKIKNSTYIKKQINKKISDLGGSYK